MSRLSYDEGASLIRSVILGDAATLADLARGESAKVVICRAQFEGERPRLDCYSPCIGPEARATMKAILAAMDGSPELIAKDPEDRLTFTAAFVRAESATERALYKSMSTNAAAIEPHAARVSTFMAQRAAETAPPAPIAGRAAATVRAAVWDRLRAQGHRRA